MSEKMTSRTCAQSPSKLRAYFVSDEDDSAVIVYAKTNGHARRLGANQIDGDWFGVRASRAPQYDSLCPRGPSDEELFADGWHFSCQVCDMPAWADNGGVCVAGRVFYCADHAVEATGQAPSASSPKPQGAG